VRGWAGFFAVCAGCTAPNPAFDLGSGSGGGSAEVGEGPGSSEAGSGSGGSSESGDIPLICPPAYDGPPAIASVILQDGNGMRICGGSVFGAINRPDPEVVNEYELTCDAACGACPDGPYSLVFGNGDPNLGQFRPCVQVLMAGEPQDGGCAFHGMAMFDVDGSLLYAAGARESLFDPLLSSLVPITVESQEPCRCDGIDCCTMAPGSYAMVVTTDQDTATVLETETGFVTLGGRDYQVENLRAHVHPECGGEEHFDWVARPVP
jgi:hypothetical protein